MKGKNIPKNIDRKQVPVFILAGGLGTRLSEETQARPKPMVEIGNIPILLHIMRFYFYHGFNDFIICAGYRSWDIKNFFLNYQFRANHLDIDHRTSTHLAPEAFGTELKNEKWRVRVVDTGLNSMTGSRLALALDVVSNQQDFSDFALTYGDGLTDADLGAELEFHRDHQRIGTVLAVTNNQSRFGVLDVESNNSVAGFLEKPEEKQDIISGGFFFFKKQIRKYIWSEEDCILERKPLEDLARDAQLMSYRHQGFWHPMDTLRDKHLLEQIWSSGGAPWSPVPAARPKISKHQSAQPLVI